MLGMEKRLVSKNKMKRIVNDKHEETRKNTTFSCFVEYLLT